MTSLPGAAAAWGFGSAKDGVAREWCSVYTGAKGRRLTAARHTAGTGGTPVDAAAPPVPAPAAADPMDHAGFLEADVLKTPPRPAYDGTEYRLGVLTFRPRDFVIEAYLLAAIALYYVASLVGARINRSEAKQWYDKNLPVLQPEFAGLGLGDENKQFVADGNDEFLSYATGRRAVAHAWLRVQTKPRHDPFSALYHLARGVIDYNYVSGLDRIVSLDIRQ